MAHAIVPHFHNGQGVATISVGVTEFMCIGAPAPHDHPHVYLDMGDDGEKVCPYCSTLYKHDAALSPVETVPPHCLLGADDTVVGIDAKAAPIRANTI